MTVGLNKMERHTVITAIFKPSALFLSALLFDDKDWSSALFLYALLFYDKDFGHLHFSHVLFCLMIKTSVETFSCNHVPFHFVMLHSHILCLFTPKN